MKKSSLFVTLSLLLLFSGCSSYTVYPVSSKPKWATQGGMLFALPQTELLIDMTLSTHDTTGAKYAKYAAEMIGAGDDNTHFAISQVNLSAHNVADPRAYFYVEPRRISVVIDKNHLLRSIGVPPANLDELIRSSKSEDVVVRNAPDPILAYNLYDRADTFYVKGDRPGKPSLVATKPDVKSLRQRALEAAEELDDVQIRLQALEHGDFEDEYSMEQIQYLTKKLQQRESELLRQFIGTPIDRKVRFTMTPKDEKKMIEDQTQVICYFSPLLGIVDSNIFNAEPVYCRVQCDNGTRSASRFVKFRTDGQQGKVKSKSRQSFKYRVAEMAKVTIYCSQFKITKNLPIVQFGPTVDLPQRRFQAVFDTTTGDLLYYGEL